MPAPVVRRAEPSDEEAVALLLHESAAAMYNRFAGGPERALRVLRRAFREPGTNAGADVVWVAEIDGRVAAVAAAFPVDEAVARGSAFLRLTLRSIPPWRWPSTLWLYWAGARAAPSPPGESFYIDALATDPELRRRGAARALLQAIEERARKQGLPAVALDTGLDNKAARALYAGAGFEEVAYRPPGRGLPGFVALVKPLS
jgi:ribosomal protein S18 acetylase RimI-like enzyme